MAVPALQRRRNIGKNLAVQFAFLVSLEPDFALEFLQGGRFPILIHQPLDVSLRRSRPRRRIQAAADVFLIFTLKTGHVRLRQPGVETAPDEREENVVDKSDW